MTRTTSIRYAVFVWDADGDMGAGVVLGAFRTLDAANDKADTVTREADRREDGSYVQAIVVDMMAGATGARAAVDAAATNVEVAR